MESETMNRSKSRSLIMLACVLATLGAGSAAADNARHDALFGFTASGAAQQQSLEQRFDAQLDAADLREWLKRLSSAPNHVGSPHNKANAEFMLKKFREFGWDAEIETFSVLYPTPKKIQVQMLGPEKYDAVLGEPVIEGDASTKIRDGVLPPYNVYGGDGDVTGELVYVNFGGPDDYVALARRGIDVRGKIVIARYGGGWRGLKPQLAQKHGAVGCLIYSDPHEDGYFKGDVYPKGGWRPEQGVQRGSVADMQVYPGDPLTPGIGSTPGAKRLALEDAKTILKIPVLPISYGDATPLLKALEGPVAPEEWRGSLPLTYKIGPGPAKVRIVVESNWDQQTIYNVVAKLKGSMAPDQWVLRGNHRDTWVLGAQDPLSGTVSMLAEAKAMGELVKQGWRPKRTLVYNSWDGEEAGLLGSTEWVETHADELRKKAVVYINTDTNSRGFLGAGGSHSLQHLINQVASSVTDPQTGVSVQERLRARLLVAGYEGGAAGRAMAKVAAAGGDLPIHALGSGSDYSPFLEHLGIASMNIGFGGESDQAGVYHSHYDTYEHFERFGDPGLTYGVVLAKVTGRIAMRMADADVLPLRFNDFGDTVSQYMGELHKLVASMREATGQQHRLLDANAFKLATDPTRPIGPPVRDSIMPKIELAPLEASIRQLEQSMRKYQAALAKSAAVDFKMPAARQARLNDLIGRMEQSLTDAAGLPGREWFKHMIYAPGMLTGYGVKTLPGVREALESRRWDEANEYAVVTAKVVDRYRAQIDKVTALLDQP
jgi:N-acetylated-alpha-linked acidic dipeptidase